MKHREIDEERVDAEVRHLNVLRQEFWDLVRARGRVEAERVQKAISDYPFQADFFLYDYPAIADTWSSVAGETGLPLDFLDEGPVPSEIWEARAEIERLGTPLRGRNTEEFERAFEESAAAREMTGPLRDAATIHSAVSSYFAGLDPDLRRHPILRSAMAASRGGITTVSSQPSPPLSVAERAELKRRRIYEWSRAAKPNPYMADIMLLPPSASHRSGDYFPWIERRVRELVEGVAERFIRLFVRSLHGDADESLAFVRRPLVCECASFPLLTGFSGRGPGRG